MDKISPDYVVGFVDGQGNFSAVLSHNHRYPKFVVISKNQLIIKQLREFFKVGRIAVQKPKRKAHSTMYVYMVARHEEIGVIVDFFTSNPPIVKAKEFERFKECFLNWKPMFVRRGREENVRALNNAIRLYREGASIKDIVAQTKVDLKKLYSILRAQGLRRYKKASKIGPAHRARL
ncbi:MAG: LAGLIDADG family homing endonuclease [Nitrososphaeria archaeon]